MNQNIQKDRNSLTKRQALEETLNRLENAYWSAQLQAKRIKHSKDAMLLKQNESLKDAYAGQTCFVLGNGPSLKLEARLAEIAQYPTFTVNQFYRSELFSIVKPSFHVMVDPLFFSLDENNPDENDTLMRIREVAANPDVTMIFPVDAYGFIKNKVGHSDKHVYIKERFRMGEEYNSGFNMSGYLPVSCNVNLTAIYCAIYMGFKRIVILGCDMTGLLDNYVRRSPSDNSEKFTHIYEYTEEEKRRMQQVHATHSNEKMLNGFAKMFHDFRVLTDCCSRLNISLLNATQETALDMIPYTTLDEVLDGKQSKSITYFRK